jgi:hypothetical protein
MWTLPRGDGNIKQNRDRGGSISLTQRAIPPNAGQLASVSTGGEPLRARIDITLVDIYRREHKLLPEGYIHPQQPDSDWYFEPSEQEFDIRAESSLAAPARPTAREGKEVNAKRLRSRHSREGRGA